MTVLGFTAFDREYLFDCILSQVKDQTIRENNALMRNGKLRIRPGIPLQLYWKLRTKECEKIADARCTETFQVFLDCEGESVFKPRIDTTGDTLLPTDLELFWRRDGFQMEQDFFNYFHTGWWWVFRWRLGL